jgi:hypothetical protein
MKKQLMVVIISLLIVMMLLSGCYSVKNSPFSTTFEVPAEVSLINLYNHVGGVLTLSGKESINNVTLHGFKEAYDYSINYDDIIIDSEINGNAMTIEMNYNGNTELVSFQNCEIDIPNYIKIGDVYISNGEVEIRYLSGPINITIEKTYNERTHVEYSGIHLLDVYGMIQISTLDGVVSAATYSDELTENVSIISSVGMNLRILPILNMSVEMNAPNGNVTVGENVQSFFKINESYEGYVKGKFGQGGPLLSAFVSEGDIHIYSPFS